MLDEKKLKQAQLHYSTLCKMLDANEWRYTKYEDDFTIKTGAKGEDIPIDYIVRIDPERMIASFISWLPFNIPEDKRTEGAVAVAVANNGLCDGSFDYNIADGEIMFRLTACYRGSILGEELFDYMVICGAKTVDDYNDKFLMLAKGMLSLEKFIEMENE